MKTFKILLFSIFYFSFWRYIARKRKDDLHPFSPEDYAHDSSSLEGLEIWMLLGAKM
jgi:hypothetical protein